MHTEEELKKSSPLEPLDENGGGGSTPAQPPTDPDAPPPDPHKPGQ